VDKFVDRAEDLEAAGRDAAADAQLIAIAAQLKHDPELAALHDALLALADS
jgi:hypothetical protein